MAMHYINSFDTLEFNRCAVSNQCNRSTQTHTHTYQQHSISFVNGDTVRVNYENNESVVYSNNAPNNLHYPISHLWMCSKGKTTFCVMLIYIVGKCTYKVGNVSDCRLLISVSRRYRRMTWVPSNMKRVGVMCAHSVLREWLIVSVIRAFNVTSLQRFVSACPCLTPTQGAIFDSPG